MPTTCEGERHVAALFEVVSGDAAADDGERVSTGGHEPHDAVDPDVAQTATAALEVLQRRHLLLGDQRHSIVFFCQEKEWFYKRKR